MTKILLYKSTFLCNPTLHALYIQYRLSYILVLLFKFNFDISVALDKGEEEQEGCIAYPCKEFLFIQTLRTPITIVTCRLRPVLETKRGTVLGPYIARHNSPGKQTIAGNLNEGGESLDISSQLDLMALTAQ